MKIQSECDHKIEPNPNKAEQEGLQMSSTQKSHFSKLTLTQRGSHVVEPSYDNNKINNCIRS